LLSLSVTDPFGAELPHLHYRQAAFAREAINEIEMLASPVKAFITECCAVGPKMTVSVDDLWIEYTLWCDREGRKDPGNKQWFGRNLRSAVPGIKVSKPHSGKPRPGKPNSGKARVLSYQGIGLNTEATKAAAEAAKKVQTAVGSRRQM